MKNSNFDIERLRTLPIEEVARQLGIQLHKNKCLCFIHDEKTPSFHIYPKKNIWKCFGCGESGDVIELVRQYYKCDFIEACKWLSSSFGIGKYILKGSVIKKKAFKLKKEIDNKPDSEVYQWFFDNLV